jgi:hypothetical protein
MKGILSSCAVAAVAAVLSGQAGAAVIAADSFETYPAGSQLESNAGVGQSGGTGFTGAWNTTDTGRAGVTIAAQSLDYAAGAINIDGGNNALLVSGATNLNEAAARQFPTQDNTPVYFSFLYRTTNDPLTSEDFIQVGLSNAATGEPPVSVGTANNAAGNAPPPVFFVRNPTTAGNSVNSTIPLEANRTYLVVGKGYSTGGSTTYNAIDLFLDPTTTTEPALATLSRVAPVGQGPDTVSFFDIRTARLDAGDQYSFDNITIASTFEEAVGATPVPEPATVATLAVAAVGMLVRRRRGA